MSESTESKIPPYPPQYRREKSNNWWVPVLIVLGSLAIIFFGIIGLFFYAVGNLAEMNFDDSMKSEVKITDNSILYIDLENGVPEYVTDNPFAGLNKSKTPENLLNTLNAIDRAADDENIIGIYLRPKSQLPMSRAFEINAALDKFKESGKFIYSFIEVGNENTYFSCLPSDSIFMPSEGMLEMNGLASTGMFVKGFGKKLGIEFTVVGYEDFKSAGEMLSRDSWSDSAKYQNRVLLDQFYGAVLEEISTRRGMDKDMVHSKMSQGMYLAKNVHEAGFIDGLLSEYDLKRFIRNKYYDLDTSDSEHVDPKIDLVSVSTYMASDPPSNREIAKTDDRIALIYASGAIQSGYGESNPFADQGGIYSDKFIKHLRQARNDDDVKLIILRIDSPGGSAIASDEMWEEIQRTREVKPVWASMSSVAASGGYYMAMGCDKIYAHPHTITGSIGVILQMPNLSNMFDKLDITFDTLKTAPNAQFLNNAYPFNEKDKQRLYALSGEIYKTFVTKAAESRGFDYETMRSKAKGRVWSGKDALEQGLVDELGGLSEVLADAKEFLGVNREDLIKLEQYPRQKDSFDEFIKEIFGPEKDPEMGSTKINTLELLGLDSENLIANFALLPEDVQQTLIYQIRLAQMSQNENTLMAMPYLPIIK